VLVVAVLVHPEQERAPNWAESLTEVPVRSVYVVTGNVIVVAAQPPVTLHDSDRVNVVVPPAGTVTVDGLIPTLAPPAAEAPAPGKTTARSATKVRLSRPARTGRNRRLPVGGVPGNTPRDRRA
jgi:hypothetical protein